MCCTSHGNNVARAACRLPFRLRRCTVALEAVRVQKAGRAHPSVVCPPLHTLAALRSAVHQRCPAPAAPMPPSAPCEPGRPVPSLPHPLQLVHQVHQVHQCAARSRPTRAAVRRRRSAGSYPGTGRTVDAHRRAVRPRTRRTRRARRAPRAPRAAAHAVLPPSRSPAAAADAHAHAQAHAHARQPLPPPPPPIPRTHIRRARAQPVSCSARTARTALTPSHTETDPGPLPRPRPKRPKVAQHLQRSFHPNTSE